MRAVLLLFLVTLIVACQAMPAARESAPSDMNISESSGTDWKKAERITVVLSDFKFTPAHIALKKDLPYQLHLENKGSGGHNFKAPEFFAIATFRDNQSALNRGVVELAKGETKDIFLVPHKSGTFDLICSHFLHPGLGMTGKIIVQ